MVRLYTNKKWLKREGVCQEHTLEMSHEHKHGAPPHVAAQKKGN
jgi:hypothetical protein